MTGVIGLVVILFIGAWFYMTSGAQYDPKIQKIAQAIAKAEGFYVAGSVPARANNPGDLKLGDTGNGTIDGKTIFPDLNTGWQALYHQVGLMISGQSNYYDSSMTWRDIANTWVGTTDANNWMLNVVTALGVSPDSTLGDYYAV